MVDRSKDIVKSGGENVSSLRVEAVLFQHPHVQKSAVVGLPHEQLGRGRDRVRDRRGRGERRPRRARRVLPRAARGLRDPEAGRSLVDELPVTVGGKVLKYKLRAAHAQLYDD